MGKRTTSLVKTQITSGFGVVSSAAKVVLSDQKSRNEGFPGSLLLQTSGLIHHGFVNIIQRK